MKGSWQKFKFLIFNSLEKSNNSFSLDLHQHENLKYSPKYGAYFSPIPNFSPICTSIMQEEGHLL